MSEANQEEDQLPYLGTFSKAAELCSFTAVAKALGLSQAAVSQRIQALEKILRVPLFCRQGGRVQLTAAGQSLYAYAERILTLHREARQEISGLKTPVSGALALAASSVPGEHLLPALLSVFHQRYPDIHVRASVSDSQDVINQIQHGKASLGLVGRKCDEPHLEFRHLATDRMVLVASAKHAWANRRQVSLKQLCGQPLILREIGSGLRHCLEKSLGRAGKSLRDLQVALELGSNEAIKEAVLRNVGVAVLSSYAVQKELQTAQLHALEVTGLHCDRDMYVVWDRRRVWSSPTRVFLSFLESKPIPELTHKPRL
jgi:DNA-binding transcriptional LysR family regulator